MQQNSYRYTADTMHFQWGRKPQNCPFPCDCVTSSEEDRATAISNMHKKLGKDRVCGSNKQTQTDTDRQTHRRSHYNTSPPLPWAK